LRPGDDLYDAKFTVLGESVNHHIREEQSEMFPKVRKTKLDLNALGQRMAQRRAGLESKLSPVDEGDPVKRGLGSARSRASASPQY
jgi:hypothetical protein